MAADSEQRQLALDPNQSFAVSAPAGSGKTGLLTQRVLKLLALVENPEEILCLTFTRKAAAEMQHRISSALALAATTDTEPEDNYQATTWRLAKAALERDSQQNWQLLNSPNRLRINTIDGFFRHLAQQLALESGVGDFIEPLEQPQPHYQQVVADFLLSQLQANGHWADDIATLLQHQDNNLNRLQDLLVGLLEKREQWLQHLIQARDARPYLEQFLQETIAETLLNLHKQLQPVASDLAILADYAATTLANNDTPSPLSPCLGMEDLPPCDQPGVEKGVDQWLGLAHLLMTNASSPDWRKDGGINIKLGFPTGKTDPEWGDIRKNQLRELLAWCRQQDGLLEALIDVRNLPQDRYSDQQWLVLNALTRLLPALAMQLKLYFQQQGCSDFTEVTLAALRSLGDEDQPTDLALKLDYQIQHILVDEFQDTSTIQFEILQNLIREWTPDDGRSLFIVGDGMQSLYGFRNANVGLFLEARQQPIGNIQLKPLDLTVNFRSQAGVIDWVNEAFSQAFPTRENIGRGAVSYCAADAFHPQSAKQESAVLESDEQAVTLDVFEDQPDDMAQAQRVIALVSEAKQKCHEGSIAILVRNRSHLKSIIKALRDAGISWQAAEIDPLQNKMPVVDLMSLTRALLSPADRIAWLSILRAPWCGLDLHDLYYLANTAVVANLPGNYPLLLNQIQNHSKIDEISTEGHQILNRVSGVLDTAWQQRDRQPLRHWLECTWLALGGAAALNNDADREYCQQYFDFLEQQSPIHDWLVFQRALEKLYAAANPDADPLLQVMTIHKAKGLEFDTVIIPGLEKAGRSNQQELLLWRERISADGHSQLLIAPLQGSGQDKEALYRHLQHEAKIKEQLESTRVLYVGATRAIHQLHMLCGINNGRKPAKNSLLAQLWPWLEPALESQHPAITVHPASNLKSGQTEDGELLASYTHLQRLPAEWHIDTRADCANNIAEEDGENASPNQGKTPAVYSPPTTNARYMGIVLHRILRQITLQGIANWGSARIEKQTPRWSAQLRQLGVDDTEAATKLLQEAVRNVLTDEDNHWLLDNSHDDSQCEYPLGYIDDNQRLCTAIIDRTFIANGVRWIVDYKSSQPEADETQKQFLRRQRSEHQPQLQKYADLMGRLQAQQKKPLPIKTALYFPLTGYLDVLS